MSINELQLRDVSFFSLRKILKYLSVGKINFLSNFAYLSNMLSRTLPVVIRIWIFVQLYEVAFSVSGVSSVNNLTVTATVWILAFAQSFQGATRPPINRIVNDEVRSGDLQYVISRPYSYVGFHYFSQMGKIFANLLFNLSVAVVVCFFFVGGISFSAQGIGWGILLMFMGLTLDFLLAFLIGILAFWIEDSTSMGWLYHKAQIIFGGLILPIAMFPDKIRHIVELLPFSQLFYSAASVMVNFDMQMVKKSLLIQGSWIIFFLIVVMILFRRGIKNISING